MVIEGQQALAMIYPEPGEGRQRAQKGGRFVHCFQCQNTAAPPALFCARRPTSPTAFRAEPPKTQEAVDRGEAKAHWLASPAMHHCAVAPGDTIDGDRFPLSPRIQNDDCRDDEATTKPSAKINNIHFILFSILA
jgi:hypothetical protein